MHPEVKCFHLIFNKLAVTVLPTTSIYNISSLGISSTVDLKRKKKMEKKRKMGMIAFKNN